MAIDKNELTEAILHGALTDQQVAYIQRDLLSYMPEYTAPFETFYEHRSIPAGYSSVQFKRLLVKPVSYAETERQFLDEDVAPAPEHLKYATYSRSTRTLRRKYVYTDIAVRENYTNLLSDITRTLGHELGQDKANILANGLLSTRSEVTPAFSSGTTVDWDTTLKKLKIVLNKNFAKPIDGLFYLLVPYEVGDDIAKMIEAKGSALAENVKQKLASGDVFDYYGYRIRATNHPSFYTSDGKMNVLFIGNAPDGSRPAWDYGVETPDIIAKGLGAGGEVLLDQNGDLTGDGNNQRGSVAANLYGVSAAPVADTSILRMTVSGTIVGTSDGVIDISDPTAFTGYVSSSHSPTDTQFWISADRTTIGTSDNLQLVIHKGEDITDSVTWESGTTETATINSSTGLLTAVATGTTVVTAKAGSYTATITITVE